MSRLNRITHLENMIYHKDYSKYSHAEMVSEMKNATDEFVHNTKPKEKPAKICARFIELERIYGLHQMDLKSIF